MFVSAKYFFAFMCQICEWKVHTPPTGVPFLCARARAHTHTHTRILFDVTTRKPGSSQFCVQVTKEIHVDCNHFCHPLFLYLWKTPLITYCSIIEEEEKKREKERERENVSPREKVWSIGFYHNLFLTRIDR